MRTFGKWILVFGLLVTCVSFARSADPANPEKIIPREGAVQLILLCQHSVQDDLKLTKDQIQKIEAFADSQWKKMHEIHKLEPEKAHPKFEDLGKENVKFISETLKPEQHKRLDQISMHVAGLLWALDPKVAQALNLTDAQKQKIKELHKAAHKEVEAAFDMPDKAARHTKFEELRKAHRKELMMVLTDEQKTKWKEMAGEPFKGKLEIADHGPAKGKP